MAAPHPMVEIPIAAARAIAEEFGYDQVVVIGRRVGADPQPSGEHVTTAGIDEIHASIAARAGRAIQRFMQWPLKPDDPVVKALGAAVMALRSYQHGNAAPDLAAEIADVGEDALRAVGCPLEGARS